MQRWFFFIYIKIHVRYKKKDKTTDVRYKNFDERNCGLLNLLLSKILNIEEIHGTYDLSCVESLNIDK